MITFEDVFTYDNLVSAYFHCRKGKVFRQATIHYHESYMINLYKLLENLKADKYKIGQLYSFIIYEPKKRYVTANRFEDKIIQRILCKHTLEPTISPTLIYDNYATQPNKGTHKGVERLVRHMRAFAKDNGWTSDGFVLVCDVQKFFYTIDKQLCIGLVNKLDIDDKLKRMINDQIMIYDSSYNEYSDDPNQGICIGFQISQWLAVYYLSSLDHYIKEQLRIKYYGRYMDDFILIHRSRKYLEKCLTKINEFISTKLRLTLNAKTHIHPFSQGICFLGYHCTYNITTHSVDIKIRNKSVKRMLKRTKRQTKLIRKGIMTPEQAFASLRAWYAYACHGMTDRAYNAYAVAYDMIDALAIDYKLDQLCDNPFNVDEDGYYILRYKDSFDAYPIPIRTSKAQAERDAIRNSPALQAKVASANFDTLLKISQRKKISKSSVDYSANLNSTIVHLSAPDEYIQLQRKT